MKVLTKQDKINFCIHAIAYYEDEPYEGLCSLFGDFFETNNVDIQKQFPELYAHKPTSKRMMWGLFWFPTNPEGYYKRIQILKQVKEELYNAA